VDMTWTKSEADDVRWGPFGKLWIVAQRTGVMFRCANMEHTGAKKFWEPKYEVFCSMRNTPEK